MGKQDRIKSLVSDFCVIVIIAVIAFSAIFTRSISNLDEIWNFNFARNIADGLVPYRDFNMVPTPLLSMICGLVLLIFGKELLIMRYLAVCLICLVFFMAYKILDRVVPKNVTILLMAVFLSLYKEVMCIDYNYAVLLIGLILLYIELKNVKKEYFEYNFIYNFVVGFISGLAILFKQSTGLAVCVACITYKFFEIRRKEDIKQFLKIVRTRLLGSIVPGGIFLIYLLVNDSWNDFINYTILGVRTFSNKVLYSELLKNDTISVLAMLVPCCIAIMFAMLFSKKVKEEICIFFAYSISSFIVAFPISDNIHFLIGAMIPMIGCAYIIYEYVFKVYANEVKKEYRLFTYGVITFVSFLFLLLLVYNSVESIEKNYIYVEKEKSLSHFIGIPEDVGLKDRIEQIDAYILEKKDAGKKVYILDAEAALYYIPLDMYNKDYDMFNKGNLGAKGEEGIIEDLKKKNDFQILILQDRYTKNWQMPLKVIEYVKTDLNKIGSINVFDIYEK